ncbi:SIS domain-containing protein [Undibacterium arcticum]
MIENIKASLLESKKSALESFLSNRQSLLSVEAASAALIATVENKGKVYSCGNGGSMCDATHFCGRTDRPLPQKNRAGIGAIAINDPSHISCVANDFGYDYVFFALCRKPRAPR